MEDRQRVVKCEYVNNAVLSYFNNGSNTAARAERSSAVKFRRVFYGRAAES